MSTDFIQKKAKTREGMTALVTLWVLLCISMYFFIFISKIICSNENVFIIVFLSAFLITGFKSIYDRVSCPHSSDLISENTSLSTKLFFALEAWLAYSIIISFLIICMWIVTIYPIFLWSITLYVPAVLILIVSVISIYDWLEAHKCEKQYEQSQYKRQCDKERYDRQEESFRKFRIAYIKALRSPVSYEIVTNYRNFDIAKDYILTSTSALSDTYTGEAKSWLFSAKSQIKDLGEFGKNLSDLIDVAVSNFWDYEVLSEDCSRLHRIIWLCARAITLYRKKLDRMYKKRKLDMKTIKVIEHVTEGMDLTNESNSLDDMLRELRLE